MQKKIHIPASKVVSSNPSRRVVLKWTAGTIAGSALFAGSVPNFGIGQALAAKLGSGDTAVLNYAYALEQLQAAFYAEASTSAYTGISADEREILSDIRDHEQQHRQFLASLLADQAIADLEIDLSRVDFTDRTSVLTSARQLEDLTVSAYNGATHLLSKAEYVLAFANIASVEARHAATIRNLIRPLSVAFAGSDIVDSSGLDVAASPSKVLTEADSYFKSPISADGLGGE